jgi:hypothetical protein
MGKKDLASVTTDLSALASMMPTQHAAVIPIRSTPSQPEPAPTAPPAPDQTAADEPKPRTSKKQEEIIQFSMGLRKSLRKQLARVASDADMTMRAFVLHALKDKGISVREDDLLDLRKERR